MSNNYIITSNGKLVAVPIEWDQPEMSEDEERKYRRGEAVRGAISGGIRGAIFPIAGYYIGKKLGVTVSKPTYKTIAKVAASSAAMGGARRYGSARLDELERRLPPEQQERFRKGRKWGSWGATIAGMVTPPAPGVEGAARSLAAKGVGAAAGYGASQVHSKFRNWVDSDEKRQQRYKWGKRGMVGGAAAVAGRAIHKSYKQFSPKVEVEPSRIKRVGLAAANAALTGKAKNVVKGAVAGAVGGYGAARLRQWYKNRQKMKKQVESLRVLGNLREMSPQRAAWAAETAMKAYKNPHIPALRKGLRKSRYPSTLYSMANKFARYARKKETMMDTLYNPVKLPSFVGSAYRSGA